MKLGLASVRGAVLVALSFAACAPPLAPPTTQPPPMLVAPTVAADARGRASADAENDTAADAEASGEQASVHLYVMSHCPYGVQVENNLRDVVAALGPRLRLEVDYIGDLNAAGVLSSMHGAPELADDLVQVCAERHAPRSFYRFVLCQNRDLKKGDWKPCADEVGIAVEPLRACAAGDEGRQLLAESFARSRLRRATGSPTIYIGDTRYTGGRRPRELLKAVCASYASDPPETCRDIPPPVPVQVVVLGDRRCTTCESGRLEAQVKRHVEAPVFRALDYGDPEGRALFSKIAPANLPAVVFDDSLDRDPDAAAALARSLKTTGAHKVLSMGEWSPVCADPGGCARADCRDTMQCRTEVPRKLELFVMSHCPFGAKAVAAMADVYKAFGDATLAFSLHFIGTRHPKRGLTSMHGQLEVDDDLREVCAAKYYAPRHKFMDFVGCRAASYKDPNWRACTGGATGIDDKLLARCAEGPEGATLLEASFELAQKLGIGASPTWVVNGRHEFSGLDFETVRKNVCQHNPQLKPCAGTPAAVRPPGPLGPPTPPAPPSPPAPSPTCGPTAADPSAPPTCGAP
ncbi:MAG: hypothetical protein HY908_24105 [Myxococcales bacterium]|nr:hypothetical protein [Myxococcales bacterium]